MNSPQALTTTTIRRRSDVDDVDATRATAVTAEALTVMSRDRLTSNLMTFSIDDVDARCSMAMTRDDMAIKRTSVDGDDLVHGGLHAGTRVPR